MAVNFEVEYPVEIGEAAWKALLSTNDKNGKAAAKGAATKIAAAEAAWKLIRFNRLAGRGAGKAASPEAAATAKAAAAQERDGAVKRAMDALNTAASAAAAVRSDTAVQPEMAKAAGKVEKGLLAQSRLLRDLKLDDFDAGAARVGQRTNMQMIKFKQEVAGLADALEEVKRRPTRSLWNDRARPKFRSVTAALGTFPELEDLWENWKAFDGMQADNHLRLRGRPTPEVEADVILELVQQVEPHLLLLKKRLQ